MSDPESSASSESVLFVGNIGDAATQQDLHQAFLRFGRVKECQLVVNKQGEPRGFGFVVFERRVDARAAKDHLDGATAIHSRQLKVRWARDPAVLFVGDLSPSIREGVLLEAFKQFGDVVSCRIERASAEQGGGSLGYGFIEFGKRTVAAKVQQLMSDNLFMLGSSPRPVRVEFALGTAAEHEAVDALNNEDPPPHFAQPGTLEFDFALKWREISLAHGAERERLRELHRQEREIVQAEQKSTFEREKNKLKDVESLLHGGAPLPPGWRDTSGFPAGSRGAPPAKRPRGS